jgi:ADP-heptose:LPS heptosyltransferase
VIRLLHSIRGVGKLAWLVVTGCAGVLAGLLRGDTSSAADHAREIAGILHEDLMKAVVAVQKVLPLWRTDAETVDRILIVKLDRIGDMVNTTPVFDALRHAFPRARVDIVGHPGPLALLEGDERLNERTPYKTWMYHPLPVRPGGPRTWALVWRLLWRRYPLVVYLRGSFPFLWLALTSRFAAARFVPGEPVVTRYLKAIEPITGPVANRTPRLIVRAEMRHFARDLLAADGRDGPVVVIHAAASTPAKIWPLERFAALADRLKREVGARIHFLGSPEDRAGLKRIAELAEESHAYHSTLRLPQVTGVIACADLFIGNDSGLSHIASAVDTPEVIIWGPVNLSMARPEAPASRCVVLYHELACRSGCREISCGNPVPFECLLRTQIDDVFEAACALLNGGASRQPLPLTSM